MSEDVIAIEEIVQKPIEQWKELLKNDFETSVFKRHPEIELLKEALYQSGAIYAAMSGSGSSVFGLFTNEDAAMNFNSIHLIYKGRFKNQA